jgi:hypothetical protein
MHRLAAALLSLSFAAAPAIAKTAHASHVAPANTCTNSADKTAFDTEGLKSELMVTALACKQQDKYNSFMQAYKPAVAAEEKDLGAYFKRVYGRQYQKAYDDYISNLANVQEQEGLKEGTAFCQIFQNMFDEVMSLHSSTELADYAHSQAIVQPVAFTTCAEAPAKTLAKSKHRVTKHKAT